MLLRSRKCWVWKYWDRVIKARNQEFVADESSNRIKLKILESKNKEQFLEVFRCINEQDKNKTSNV